MTFKFGCKNEFIIFDIKNGGFLSVLKNGDHVTDSFLTIKHLFLQRSFFFLKILHFLHSPLWLPTCFALLLL